MNLSQNESLPISGNPFFHRGPIRNRRYFFGRTGETRQALPMLREGQCVSIVGPRRIGKTSFLFHLCDPAVQKEHGLGEEYLFVYIDCQGWGNLDKPQFYQWLWQEVKRTLTERGKAEDRTESISDFSGFREAIMMTIQREGYRPVFLFDEFDTIAKNLNLDLDLFSDLRSLISQPSQKVPGRSVLTAIYATASQTSLYDLTYADKSVLSSPFFNVFSETPLGLLEREEAEELVLGLLRVAGQGDLFTEKDFAFVFEAAGYHPFFLQLVCYHLFEQKMERKDLTAADYESVQQNYAGAAEAHFRYIWENLDANEQETVRLVCKGRVSQLDDKQKRRLERKCILYNDAFFSSIFAEFVRRQMTEKRALETREAKLRRTPEVKMRRILDWFRKVVVTLVVILFVLSAVLVWPDLPDLAMKVLNVENVTSIVDPQTGEEVLVKVYSPKLLFVGETAFIEVQTYGPEKPEFEVIAHRNSSDVVITEKGDAFEIKCKGTNANMLSRSEPIEVEVKATMPAGTSATAVVTMKTNYFLSLLARVGVLLTSGGLSVKKLWEWLMPIGKRKQTPHSLEQAG